MNTQHIPLGTRVYLRGDHPWSGKAGEIISGLMRSSLAFLPPAYSVLLDSGIKCMACPKDIEVMKT